MNKRDQNGRVTHLRWGYAFGLGAIALLAVGSQLSIQNRLQSQLRDSEIVNIAGRQRMLSQRIAKNSITLLRDADSESELSSEILRDLGALEHAHLHLTEGELRGFVAHASPADIASLDGKLRALVDATGAVLAGENELGTLLGASTSFLELMDRHVFRFSQESRARVERTQANELLLVATTLIVLALEALLIFGPLLRRVREQVDALLERERRLTEAKDELARAQASSAIGSLASGIAHDFNNYLQLIRMNVESLAARVGQDHDLREIEAATEESSALIRQLLSLRPGRLDSKVLQPLNVVGLAKRLIPVLKTAVGRGVNLSAEIDEPLPEIRADASLLRHSILNLVINARDAVSGDGRIIFRVSTWTDERGRLGVRFSVRDDGMGMSAEVVDRAFEPYYTTKALGRGSGLGLATVDRIARDHGGFARIESKPGFGSVVHLFVPVGGRQVEDLNAEEQDKRPGTVLIVDNDPRVLGATRRLLECLGYDVLVAQDGSEAIDAATHRDVSLCICDVMLGAEHGPSVMESLWSQAGECPTLFVSGFTDIPVKTRRGVIAFLAKPFGARELQEAIADLHKHS